MYLILYQILPPLALAALYRYLERYPAFGRYSIGVIFALGAALQLALWTVSRPNLDNPDSLGFFTLGHGQVTDLRLILFRPKLYPIFLGLFATPKAATLAQCFLKLATGCWIPRLGARLGWRPATVAWAATLYFANSLWLEEPLKIMDTALYAALFTAALCLAWETLTEFAPRRVLAFAVAAGFASLTRQVGDATLLGLGLALTLYAGHRALWFRFRFLASAWILAVAIAASGGIWNGLHYQVYRRSVALGVVLYTHASFFALRDPQSREWDWVEQSRPGERARLGSWDTDWRGPVPWRVNALPHALERARGVRDAREILVRDDEFRGHFAAWARENPVRYLASVINELNRLLWKCEELYPKSLLSALDERRSQGFVRREDSQGRLSVFFERAQRGLIHQAPGWLLFLASIGWMLARRRKFAYGAVVLGVAVYFLLIASVIIGFTRYALPALPVLYALCAQAMESLIPSLQRWLSYLPARLRPKAMAANPNPAPNAQ